MPKSQSSVRSDLNRVDPEPITANNQAEKRNGMNLYKQPVRTS